MIPSINTRATAWVLIGLGVFSVAFGYVIAAWFSVKISRGLGQDPALDYSSLYKGVIECVVYCVLALLILKRKVYGYWVAIIGLLLMSALYAVSTVYFLKLYLPYMGLSFTQTQSMLFLLKAGVVLAISFMVIKRLILAIREERRESKVVSI